MKTNLKNLYNAYPILKNINHKNKEIIDTVVQFKTIYADDYISSASNECRGIFFVVSGVINIKRINEKGDETNLYNIKRGQLCHEALSCLLKFKSLNIIGRAIQNSVICIIPIDVVKKYLLGDNEFLKYMYEDLYLKLNAVIDKKEEKIHDSIESRLVKLLISKNSNIIYTTHKEIAFEIDSTREVVSRRLKALEKKGYIKLERGKIVLINDLLRNN